MSNQDGSPSRPSKYIPSSLESSKKTLSPSGFQEITRSPKVSSPLRFEGKSTSKLTPRKTSKVVCRSGRSWGASPAKNLSSTLDYLLPQETSKESTEETKLQPHLFSHGFDFGVSMGREESEFNPYEKEITPGPLDQALLDSFLSPIQAAPFQYEESGKVWNDFFTSEGNCGVPQSEFYDVDHSAPARMNEVMSTSDFPLLSLFANQEGVLQNQTNFSQVFDNEVEIPSILFPY